MSGDYNPVEVYLAAMRNLPEEHFADVPFDEHVERCRSSLTLGGRAMLQDLFECEGVEDEAVRTLVLWLLSSRSTGVLTFNSPARFRSYAIPVLRYVQSFVRAHPGAFGRGVAVGATDGDALPETTPDDAR